MLQNDTSNYNNDNAKKNIKVIIKNPKEKRIIRLSIVLATIFVIFSFLFATPPIAKHIPISVSIYSLLNRVLNFGSKWSAIIGIAFAMGWYVVTKLLKKNKEENIPSSKLLISFARIARLYHVPIAILALGFAFVHAYIDILNGVKLNIGYITGFIALLTFILVSISGIRRYMAKHKLHLVSSIILIALLIIHIIYFMFFNGN
ncbi:MULTISPECIES: hypothetical protein [unclassified Clostridium]|uniref:hypothetical protein n=1 Tax=unclassified Clostridium TaxID=2614128 RepID=UPI0002978F5C|nr:MULTISPECIES: hypothetical protein [unclassified Clostridium]EKQ54356.1 MAG: hypothetical protein A370_03178 [Clostridium sp. Maddingley MBC34-26]